MKLLKTSTCIFLVSLGIVISFFFSRYMNVLSTEISKTEYNNQARITSSNIYSYFERILDRTPLTTLYSLFPPTEKQVFDQISESFTEIAGAGNLLYLEKFDNSDLEEANKIIKERYPDYNLTFPEVHTVRGGTFRDISWVTTFIYPFFERIIGLDQNTDTVRHPALATLENTREPAFAVVKLEFVPPTGIFIVHPILDTETGEISKISAYMLRSSQFFPPQFENFLEIFPESDIEIVIRGEFTYSTGVNTSLCTDEDSLKTFHESNFQICFTGYDRDIYGTTFIITFVSCLLIIILTSAVLILLDIGRLRAIEHSKFKTRFISNISHEIRTPMNGIMGMTELLYERNIDVLCREYVRSIRSCGTTLLGIINDILDMSKIESCMMTIKRERTNIPLIVQDAMVNIWKRTKHSGTPANT